MITEKITSLQHKLIKHAIKLKTSRRYREENNEILLIGKEAISEVTAYLKPKVLFVPKGLEVAKGLIADKIIEIEDNISKKITGFEIPQFSAIYAFPKKQDIALKKKLLILDEIKDPGNMGTLFRTAYALGFDGIYLTKNSVDPFNDKALSASKGTALYLPFQFSNKETLEKTLKQTIYIADIKGQNCKDITYENPLALILSNEKKGPKNWSFKTSLIKIPMQKGIDSMNVAIAGAIIMHEMSNNL